MALASVSQSVSWGNCCWHSPAQSFLILGHIRTHDQKFVRSKTFVCFEMWPPPGQEEESDCYYHRRPGKHSLASGWVICCWPLPAQSLLVLSPAGVITIFYCLPTLGVADWLWILLRLYSFFRDGLGNNASDCPTAAVCVPAATEMCLDKLLCSSGRLCDASLTPEF
jgi:hypothetical protein